MSSTPPTVFVSYSWDDAQHQTWVRTVLVDGLRQRGVDARMDVYELSPGDPIDGFMETFLESCTHVVVVCTQNYYQRAGADLGGVGYEKELIKRFIGRAAPDQRVVPVVRAGGRAAVPPFLGSRVSVDMSDDSISGLVLDELAATFYGQKFHKAPALGPPPAEP